MIFRHKGLPYALCSAMSEKYKIGGSFKILDPETRAPAVKNPYFQPKPGVLQNNDIALDRLLAEGTVIVRCCATGSEPPACRRRGCNGKRSVTGMNRQFDPGRHRSPLGDFRADSGHVEPLRAQEAGCTYCAGG
jgi:hypothetical protein